MREHLFLIGARASGKTSVGKALASSLAFQWVDTDFMLEQRCGQSIAEYVAKNGWAKFRFLESQILAEICTYPPQIVSCGGGIVLLPENRKLLSQGFVVYLRAKVGLLAARLADNPLESQRPALSELPLAEELATVLKEREPLYLSCADYVLDCDKHLEILVQKIVARVDLKT